MAKNVKKMVGGMDPNAMREKGLETRRRKKLEESLEEKDLAEADFSFLPRKKLIELLRNPRTPDYVAVNAAKVLATLPEEKEEQGWRSSVQVRPDFVPPSWPEVLLVAKAAGAFD